MKFALLIITSGRVDLLQRCINSIYQNIYIQFDYKIIINDDIKSHYNLFRYGKDFKIYSSDIKLGFAGAIKYGWEVLPEDTDFVFHVEEDFIFNEPLDIYRMAGLFIDNDNLAQVALKRQRWGEEKVGFMEDNRDKFREELGNTYHKEFFTTNPSVYPYHITKLGWPQCEHSESEFAKILFKKGYHCAYLGKINDAPKVNHIGVERPVNGTGY